MTRAKDKVGIIQELVNRRWVSIPQAATLAGVSKATMESIRLRGGIKAVRVGASWRVYEDEMIRFLVEGNYVTNDTAQRLIDMEIQQ